jgi:Mn2+/Fe2+ NRAMP family transporter
VDSIITLITGPGGALVFALVLLWAGARKYWVFGWTYRDCVEEKNEWKKAAMRGVAVAERAVDKNKPSDV